MGKIRVREKTGKLFFDFRYLGKRCCEQTTLAESLAAATSIASGSGLVMWLGDGSEKSSLDALVTWTRQTLKQLDLTANRKAIPLLLAELERTL